MTEGNDIPVLVIFGPTASGKTALSEALFTVPSSPFFGRAEIISADSMQVYRGMDIGTAKPGLSFLQKLPHHLIDICDPEEQFCAGDFVRLADCACEDIYRRGKLPVILGGTAFYIRNFLYGLPVTPESDPVLRLSLRSRMRAEGASVLYKELRDVDPVSAARIHCNDEYRIIRALEVSRASGRPLSSYELPSILRRGYRFLVISLDRSREELYARIDSRVREMFDSGLETEVATLRAAGCGPELPGMQAIGYREFFTPDLGDNPVEPMTAPMRERMIGRIQHDSRKYAKRQETFIRSLDRVFHVGADDFLSISEAVSAFYSAV